MLLYCIWYKSYVIFHIRYYPSYKIDYNANSIIYFSKKSTISEFPHYFSDLSHCALSRPYSVSGFEQNRQNTKKDPFCWKKCLNLNVDFSNLHSLKWKKQRNRLFCKNGKYLVSGWKDMATRNYSAINQIFLRRHKEHDFA